MANQFGSTSLTQTLGILKINYEGPIVTQFNDDVPLYRGAEKGTEKWSGLQVNRPLKVRRNPGIGSTSDGGDLPSIGVQTTIQAVIQSRFNYLRFGLTGPMIKASQGDKGAFVTDMSYEMEQGLEDIKSDVNRQLFWNGRGDLATLSANAVASNVITVTGRTTGEAGNKYLDIGMVIDIYDTSTNLPVAQKVAITAISGTTTATVTLNSAVTASSGNIVVRANSYNNDIQGLTTVLDGATTTIYGVDRSVYGIYTGNYSDLSGVQLQLDSMQRILNENRRRGGGKISAIFCDFDSERMYNKLLVADKRYIGEKVVGDGTFTMKDQSYLEFGGAPVTPDKDCPGSNFFFMSTTGWKKYVLCELEWADEQGSYMYQQAGVDAFEVRLRLFANMFPEKPSNMGRLLNYVSP